MKTAFKEYAFKEDALDKIVKANEIIALYTAQGYRLTLRQLYYQFVTRNWITNEERSYKKLAEIVSNGRLAGMIDWEAIEDRGRQPAIPLQFNSLKHRVDSALANYRLPRWEGQSHYVELWVEKQALAGVLEPMAREFHITLMVNKGYSSQSAMYESAQRFIEQDRSGLLLYLGDHDPSGEDMVRDIADRMRMFECDLEVIKVALTMKQIRQYRPPPNPAKITDPRAKAYIAEHGDESWEVDALDIPVLHATIRRAIEEVINTDLMDEVIAREESDKKELLKAVRLIK